MILGGGRRNFLPVDAEDPEGYNLKRSGRKDNRNLIQVGNNTCTILSKVSLSEAVQSTEAAHWIIINSGRP